MLRTYAPAVPNKSPSEVGALSQRVGKLLRAFGETREGDRLTSEDALIFLALGHLGQTPTRTGVVIRPVTCLDIAALLNIPKETVRRKVARFVDMELVTSTTRGALIENQDKWSRLAESITG